MSHSPCPHCGEMLPDDATFCRHCGSDSETGWNPDVEYHSVEIPDYWTDDDEKTPKSRPWLTKVVLAVVTVSFLIGIVGAGEQTWRAVLAVGFIFWLIFGVFRR